jgi:hypothetical protein
MAAASKTITSKGVLSLKYPHVHAAGSLHHFVRGGRCRQPRFQSAATLINRECPATIVRASTLHDLPADQTLLPGRLAGRQSLAPLEQCCWTRQQARCA